MWLTALIPVLSTLIQRIFPDKAEQDKALLEMQQALNEAQAKMVDAQKNVITTEMNQKSFASNWRAYLMMICIAIVGYNWIVVSLLNAFLRPLGFPIDAVAVPPELWTLVTVGLGGYLGRETISTYSANKYGNVDDKKFYDILRQKVFTNGLSDQQVKDINAALKARDGE